MDSSTIVNAVMKGKYNRSYWDRIARRCGGIIDLTKKSKFSVADLPAVRGAGYAALGAD
ncbi:hypothetical protein A2U01_0061216, partial [Trifolium medium]|nr:hypothetical protein [Trifolium medium]